MTAIHIKKKDKLYWLSMKSTRSRPLDFTTEELEVIKAAFDAFDRVQAIIDQRYRDYIPIMYKNSVNQRKVKAAKIKELRETGLKWGEVAISMNRSEAAVKSMYRRHYGGKSNAK